MGGSPLKCHFQDQRQVSKLHQNPRLTRKPQTKLPPGANRILFVKNLNYQITGDDLYELFGRYGSIRQIRLGNEPKTKGTAFVVFDDVMDVRSNQPTPAVTPSSAYQYKGEERAGPPQWFPHAGTIYRRTLSYASEARRGRREGRACASRRRASSSEKETRHQR